MNQFLTEQEEFWAGEFGNEYILRNSGEKLLASNISLFSKALNRATNVNTCIEFGANIGMNIKALKLLYPNQEQYAIEINNEAVSKLSNEIKYSNIYNTSILDFIPDRVWDLVLIKTVLIHINPNELHKVYEKLVSSTSRYLLVMEYYNPIPVSITYRGHLNRLFKRDFAGEILDSYPQLRLVDYGFSYHRDPDFPQDDITWFLMEK